MTERRATHRYAGLAGCKDAIIFSISGLPKDAKKLDEQYKQLSVTHYSTETIVQYMKAASDHAQRRQGAAETKAKASRTFPARRGTGKPLIETTP